MTLRLWTFLPIGAFRWKFARKAMFVPAR